MVAASRREMQKHSARMCTACKVRLNAARRDQVRITSAGAVTAGRMPDLVKLHRGTVAASDRFTGESGFAADRLPEA
jgi:hypothetical protein